jgi:hypothetical protein
MMTPASSSSFSRSILQFFCCRRYSFLSSSLRDCSYFPSSERICRSSVRIASTVLFTLSSSRFRSWLVYFSSRTIRETSTFSRAMLQRSRRCSRGFAFCVIVASFSSSSCAFFWCFTSVSVRVTVCRTRACTTSSVNSSSSKMTISLMFRTPRFRSSPKAIISRITTGEREIAFSTRICPRSILRAISTSPSRVSSGTVPISRRYMRTGSFVFSSVPGVRSSSTSSPSSGSKSSRSGPPIFGPPSRMSIPCVPMVVIRSSRSSGEFTSPGRRSLTSL